MKIRETLDVLTTIDNVNKLSLEELETKYLSDEEMCKKFMNDYCYYFATHLMYQLRIPQHYDKIVSLLEKANNKYPSPENLLHEQHVLTWMRESHRRFIIGENSTKDDQIQSIDIFNSSIGAVNGNDYDCYEENISKMVKAGETYCAKGDKSIHDFLVYLYNRVELAQSGKDINDAIESYLKDHPLTKLCNDVGYLYFVNYMLKNRPSDVDDEFISDAENVMIVSQVLQELGFVPKDYDASEYEKVSNKTKRNISKHEKIYKKIEKRKIKKIKEIFTKTSNE